ncbi:hypothetical protein B0A48_18022 [Cryoendolithus antarcticus]|uniref:Transcription initiation factor TFIID subunit 4 n=1 Tax=Cryoendolithus antarcticus TaxID=1507870 RepID=A0A1V8SAZ0_9PEZI|nr:hypothetical protein B0A48_18022 [Cryoendolithus antarcticus]
MAYSPPPAHQYTYPPPQPNGSPAGTSAFHPPPAKRQRLSPVPGAHQPYNTGNGTPTYHTPPSNISNGGNRNYGPGYPPPSIYSPSAYTSAPQSAFNTPQPHPYHYPQNQQGTWQSQPTTPASAVQRASAASPQQNSAMMPPPPRPNKEEKEEKVGVEDLGDALFGSGINLKDEEAALSRSYRDSFESSTLSGGNSFDLLTQSANAETRQEHLKKVLGNLTDRFEQSDVDLKVAAKRQAAARAKAEREQHHLHNPFLLGNVLRLRVDGLAREAGVMVDVNGMYVKNRQEPPTPSATVMLNGDKTEGVVLADSKLDHGVPFADVLTLISLAAGERLRGLLDEAHALARARRYGDHGRIPPDFASLAATDDTADRTTELIKPEQPSDSAWEAPPSSTPAPHSTHPFPSPLTLHLSSLLTRDATLERARLARRAARASSTPLPTASDSLLPDALLTAAPDATPETKITKKEQLRQAKEEKKRNEETLSKSTNQTANMMALGKKGKKYAWMSGGAAGGSDALVNRFERTAAAASAGGSGTVTPKAEPTSGIGVVGTVMGGAAAAVVGGAKDEGRKWGGWSEDGAQGRGIQDRDWVLVLERDGREGKALQKALLGLGKDGK